MTTTRQDRAIEVLQWVVGLLAFAALVFVLVAAPIIYVSGDREGSLLLALSLFGILAFGAILDMTIGYIWSGTNKGVLGFLRLLWGRIPAYMWFLLAVLYLGGIGTAIWRGATDAMIFESDFAEGAGAGLAAFVIGSLGRFFRPNRLIGHITATILVGVLSIFTMLPKTGPIDISSGLSVYYSNEMHPILSEDINGNRFRAERLLFDPEFRMAAAASVSCENRFDLSMFVRDLWGAEYSHLERKYGRTVADNRSLIQESLRQFRSAGGCRN